MIQNTIMRPEFHYEGIPSKSWEKHQLHPYLNAWADVLLSNMFAKIEAQESLPIILTYVGLEHAYMFVACVVLCLLVASYSQEHFEGDALDPWIPALEQEGATI
ncbi:hypothetical protein Tco_0638257 [Tanacetum coccineum]